MAMREECKHFQSRTYQTGEVARFCVLGNAPDQPWNCPENCPTYEKRFADVGWVHGSLVDRPVEQAPEGVTAEDRQSILEAAAEIVEAVAPDLVERRRQEIDEREKKSRGLRRFFRRP
jgi:hypothetical protein